MTSYGGATSLVGSPARARWYRIPGNARTSAIGASPQLDVAQVRHAVHLTQQRQHVSFDRVVDGEDHHCAPPWPVTSHLHVRDVDVVLAEDGAEPSHHAGTVLMAAHQEAAIRDEVDSEGVDPDSPP